MVIYWNLRNISYNKELNDFPQQMLKNFFDKLSTSVSINHRKTVEEYFPKGLVTFFNEGKITIFPRFLINFLMYDNIFAILETIIFYSNNGKLSSYTGK